MDPAEHRDHVRISEAQREQLLDRLDRAAGGAISPGAKKRKDPRLVYRQANIAVTVEHPAGGSSRLLVCARNLSAGGMAFVHGGFLYPGSACRICLPTTEGQNMIVAGTIVNCRHVQAALHEVSVRFARRLDPHRFLARIEPAGADAVESVTVPRLRGRILCFDDGGEDTRLLAHHLRATGAKLSVVEKVTDACDLLCCGERIDLVCCNLDIEQTALVDAIGRVRGCGFWGPILLLTADPDPDRLVAARQAGVQHTLERPYDTRELFRIFNRYLAA